MKRCQECGHNVEDLVMDCPECDCIDFETAAPSLRPERPALPALRISVGDSAQVVPAEKSVILGREPAGPLFKQFEIYQNVSGLHATVRREGAQLTVIDSSSLGTWHSGTRLEPTRMYRFDLPVILRFASNCFVHFLATAMDEPDAAEPAP